MLIGVPCPISAVWHSACYSRGVERSDRPLPYIRLEHSCWRRRTFFDNRNLDSCGEKLGAVLVAEADALCNEGLLDHDAADVREAVKVLRCHVIGVWKLVKAYCFGEHVPNSHPDSAGWEFTRYSVTRLMESYKSLRRSQS